MVNRHHMLDVLVAVLLSTAGLLALGWLLNTTPSAAQAAPAPGHTGGSAEQPMLQATDVITVCLSGGCDYDNVQDAVTNAPSDAKIKIATGVYTDADTAVTVPLAHITKALTLVGGYTPAFADPPDPDTNPTVLDAEGLGAVLYINGSGITVTLSGLTLQRGSEGSVGVHDAQLVMTDCAVISTTAGSGVYLYNSDDSLVQRNRIIGNSGHGVYVDGSDGLTLDSNTIAGNTGNGLELQSSQSLKLDNDIVVENGGYGLHLTEAGNVVVRHNTVVSNSGGAGLRAEVNTTVAVANTIVASHTIGILATGANANVVTSHTLWYANTITNTGSAAGGSVVTVNDLAGDPQFVGGANPFDSYHIQAGSDAIDAGVNVGVNVDIDGDPRPDTLFTEPDVGADEHFVPTPGVLLAPDRTKSADFGTIITYTHVLTNDGNIPDTFTITHHSSQGWTVEHDTFIALDRGQTATLVISVAVPVGTLIGIVDITVITATSQSAPSVFDTVTDTTVIARQRVYLPLIMQSFSASGVKYLNTDWLRTDRPRYVPNEVLVKFKEGTSARQIQEINNALKAQVIHYFTFIDVYHLKLPINKPVKDALQVFRREPLVEYVALNNLHYLDVVPNDPSFGQMWGLHSANDADIDAPEAWDVITGSADIVIAVIDSGVDLNHEDLTANIWTNPGEIAGNGVDDDGNGYVDDVHGWDFSSNDNDPSPAGGACAGHGTHTAGTIGAVGNNGIGVVGVNWNVKIMPLKAFRPYLRIFCTASDADLIEAIEYHTMMSVPVSSNSWGGTNPTAAMYAAIRASNSVFVAAAGNGGLDGIGDDNDFTPHYPSSYDLNNIVAVAATASNDNRANFSNYGLTSVDLGAPGVNILSTLPNNNYDYYAGTSMATPHVAGVAGLLLAQDPNLTINEIKWRILYGTDNVGLPVLTGGRLNAHNSLQFGLSTPAVTVDIIPLGPTVVSVGEVVPYRISVTNNGPSPLSAGGRVYARLENGEEIPLDGPVTGSLDPGETVSYDRSKRVPPSAPPGITVRVFGQVETAVSFDEDWVEYVILP